MKHFSQMEHKLKIYFERRRSALKVSPYFDQRVLAEVRSIQQELPDINLPRNRRMQMFKRITGVTSAAAIILVMVALMLLHETATPVFAVQDTLDALSKVRTVHMRGEFYLQGTFECWMRFDGNPDKPTHLWLGLPDKPLCKICSPDGVFGLNRRTHRVHFASRDERNKPWLIRFGHFFAQVLDQNGQGVAVDISQETNPNTHQNVTVVLIQHPKREQRFIVDPNTKLPLRMTTLRDDDPQEMIRRTLWIRNIEWIRYNQEPPEGLFDLPANAEVVTEEVDCLVDPDNGLLVDGMTEAQACKSIVEKTAQAILSLDRDNMERYALGLRFPDRVWRQLPQMQAQGQWITEYTITGEPYPEGNVWCVPCKIVRSGDKTEVDTPMIKFYDLEGHRYAFIIGNKEKGVVD